jgi:hypothetical protein
MEYTYIIYFDSAMDPCSSMLCMVPYNCRIYIYLWSLKNFTHRRHMRRCFVWVPFKSKQDCDRIHCDSLAFCLFVFRVSLPSYYVDKFGKDFVCSPDDDDGMTKCGEIPVYRYDPHECNGTFYYPHDAVFGNATLYSNASTCVNWNAYYTSCRAGPMNPFYGSISFDNIGLAWIAIFQVRFKKITICCPLSSLRPDPDSQSHSHIYAIDISEPPLRPTVVESTH